MGFEVCARGPTATATPKARAAAPNANRLLMSEQPTPTGRAFARCAAVPGTGFRGESRWRNAKSSRCSRVSAKPVLIGLVCVVFGVLGAMRNWTTHTDETAIARDGARAEGRVTRKWVA